MNLNPTTWYLWVEHTPACPQYTSLFVGFVAVGCVDFVHQQTKMARKLWTANVRASLSNMGVEYAYTRGRGRGCGRVSWCSISRIYLQSARPRNAIRNSQNGRTSIFNGHIFIYAGISFKFLLSIFFPFFFGQRKAIAYIWIRVFTYIYLTWIILKLIKANIYIFLILLLNEKRFRKKPI